MTVTPNGDLYLCKTKLENDYKNQLTWANINTQSEYFNGTVQNTFSEYTYMKKDSTITVGASIDDIIDCNYLFYINNGFTSKRYYCFITKMEYVNENTTRITIETDCFQTWYFELQYNRCFVEREHVNDDTIGLHTVPEGLETGEYINTDFVDLTYSGYYTCIAVSENLFDTAQTPIQLYNNIPSGLTYIILKSSLDLNKAIQLYNAKTDALFSIFIIPKEFVPTPNWLQWTFTFGSLQITIDYAYVPNSIGTVGLGDIYVSIPTTINGYTPKNKKLFTYPYNFIKADNNAGTNVIYHYELFSDITNCQFHQWGIVNSGCSIKTVPINYKNIQINFNDSFNDAKLPLGSWLNDPYINWLTQNGVNMQSNLVKSTVGGIIGGAVAGGVMGAVAGGVVGGIKATYDNLIAKESHDLIPQQVAGNTNSSDIMFSAGNIAPIFYRTCIKQEFAKIIDNYWDLYGYKINIVKVPNITGRRNWNYVKTIDCNVDGDIPQTDLNIIKTMFNNGVTLWHNPNNMYNYSLDNSII